MKTLSPVESPMRIGESFMTFRLSEKKRPKRKRKSGKVSSGLGSRRVETEETANPSQ